MKPIRVQRKRTKGWKMPPNTVYVGRANGVSIYTVYQNPYRIGVDGDREKVLNLYVKQVVPSFDFSILRKRLGGKNLACWCALDQPCHADIVLELANASPDKSRSADEK